MSVEQAVQSSPVDGEKVPQFGNGQLKVNNVAEKAAITDKDYSAYEVSYDAIKKPGTGKKGTGKTRITLRLCLAVFSAVMGSVQFGYNTGVINAPEEYIKSFINKTHSERTGSMTATGTVTSLYALTVSIFAVGGVIGGLAAGWWSDFFGRKFGMIINNIIGVSAGVLMYLSRTAMSYEMVIVGRLLVGISCGLFTGLTPMYLAEISSQTMRGALGTIHQLGVVSGLLASQILGFPEIGGNEAHWNLLLGLCVTPCVVQLVTMPFCPESPRYLLLKKNREPQARRALEVLRGTPDINEDIYEMKNESDAHSSEESVNIIRLFTKTSLRRPLLISIVMQISQQFSGINAIFYYSFNLFTSAGMTKSVAAHATSGVGATMIVMTLITIPLMDRIGRRTLHLYGLGGMFIFSILITITLALTDVVNWFKYVNIVVSLLYVVFFAIGPGSIPWLIVSELFAQGSRPAAMSVSVFTNWVANFLVGYCYPYMQDGLGNYSFLPFTVLLLGFWLFTLKYVPETKNRSIEEISQLLNKQVTGTQVYEQTVVDEEFGNSGSKTKH